MAQSRKDNKGRVLRKGESYRKDGRYMFTYTDPRGKRRCIYAKDILKLRKREEKLALNTLIGVDTYAGEHTTINELFDRQMAIRTTIKDTTRANYEYMYNAHVRNGFGERCIADIKYSDVKRFYIQLVEEDGIAPITVGTIHGCLYPAFEMAVRDDILRKNPCYGVFSEICQLSEKKPKVRHALTEKEEKAFLEFIDGHPVYNHWWPVFMILIGTGCRAGEFSGLRWKDIDMKRRTISINHALVRQKKGENLKAQRLVVSTPKTEAGVRVIPMIDQVYEAFERVYAEQLVIGFNETVIDGMSGFIFKNAYGDVLSEQNINFAIKRIVKEYNENEEIEAARDGREAVILPNFSCHYLRHTFATRLCQTESNLKVIQSIMGHKSIRTTMDVYADANEEKNIESMVKLSENWKAF